MDDSARAMWNAIARGYEPHPSGTFDFEYNLLAGPTDDEARWIFRIFGDAEDALMERWLRYRAHFDAPPSSDEVLLAHASRWVAEVGRSAREFNMNRLAEVCRAGCVIADAPDPRPDRDTWWEYDEWVVDKVRASIRERSLVSGIDELHDAFWGEGQGYEMCWFLLTPIVAPPVNADLYFNVVAHRGRVQITDTRATVSRF